MIERAKQVAFLTLAQAPQDGKWSNILLIFFQE
jgi:hypothetical protein